MVGAFIECVVDNWRHKGSEAGAFWSISRNPAIRSVGKYLDKKNIELTSAKLVF